MPVTPVSMQGCSTYPAEQFGWILPDGTRLVCGYWGHRLCFLEWFRGENVVWDAKPPEHDEVITELRWIRLGDSIGREPIIEGPQRCTKAQERALMDWAQVADTKRRYSALNKYLGLEAQLD